MTIVQIQYALALLKYKSYHKASEELGISQPALSMQIQKFEQEIGFQIFDRSQRIVSVTSRGRIFLNRAESLYTEFNQLHKLSESLLNEPQGKLKIGIIPTVAPYLLPFVMEELTEKYSQLNIHIIEALTDEILEGLRKGQLDAGILSTPISTNFELEFVPLFYEGFKLYISPLHSLADKKDIRIDDIDVRDLWLLKEGNCFRNQVINMCDKNEFDPVIQHLHFESASIESLCRIVEHKKVLTIIPELSTLHVSVEKEHFIKDIKDLNLSREISMVHLPNAVYKSDLDLFCSVIRRNIPKNMLNKRNYITAPLNVNTK